jgi:hypothetical protein
MISPADREASFAAHFPRAVALLEATEIARVLRSAAEELEALAACGHAYEAGTLRRKVRGVTLATIARVVDCEREP